MNFGYQFIPKALKLGMNLIGKEYDAEFIYWQMRGRRFQTEVRKNAGQTTLPIINKPPIVGVPSLSL